MVLREGVRCDAEIQRRCVVQLPSSLASSMVCSYSGKYLLERAKIVKDNAWRIDEE